MKRALIIAAAGCSIRFRDSIKRDVLKVLFFEKATRECLLSEQLAMVSKEEIDYILIIGGYAFGELHEFLAQYHADNLKIDLIFNEKYREYGTCYSFICGLKALRNSDVDEIVFMEGDLMFDSASFNRVVSSKLDVVTTNRNMICADKSVIFYITVDEQLRYVYDSHHSSLCINEPFTSLGNSGQVWKFRDVKLLQEIVDSLGVRAYDDTNLILIENYFNKRKIESVEIIEFSEWFNCNTINDFYAFRKYMDKEHEFSQSEA